MKEKKKNLLKYAGEISSPVIKQDDIKKKSNDLQNLNKIDIFENKSEKEKGDAIKMLNKEFPDYIKSLNDSGLSLNDVKNNTNAALLFYDKDEKIQVRLKVNCIINYKNDITKNSWEKTQHISRKCYLVDNGPGTESDVPTSGLKPELDNFDYTKEQSEEGYKNFTVIQCKIKSIEWLYLAAKGHRRAKFDLESNKDTWLVP